MPCCHRSASRAESRCHAWSVPVPGKETPTPVHSSTRGSSSSIPELERSMRDTDFLHEMRSDDSMAFRAIVPLDIKQSDFRTAADGQRGCIQKLYREWQISG